MNIEQKMKELNEEYKKLDNKKAILLKELVGKGENYIFALLEEHDIRYTTDIDDELEVWFECAKNDGWSFTEAVNVISREEYMKEDYKYIILENGWNYPCFLAGFYNLNSLAVWIIEHLY